MTLGGTHERLQRAATDTAKEAPEPRTSGMEASGASASKPTVDSGALSEEESEQLLEDEEEDSLAAAFFPFEALFFLGAGGPARRDRGGTPAAPAPGTRIWPSAVRLAALRLAGVKPGAMLARTLHTIIVSQGAVLETSS
jgi:hypothetical protein